MPDITCPVCGSVNESTRTYCWKCAADLHAPVPDATQPMPTPRVEVPIQPILIGGGVALAAIALIAVLVVFLGGTPAATMSPSLAPTSVVQTADAPSGGAASPGDAPTIAPVTDAPITDPPPTQVPPTEAPATPRITPVPGPTIVSFKGPETVDCSDPSYDGFITLTWTIDNADGADLFIDGGGVYLSYPGAQRSERVPFSCGETQHTYKLTTVGGTGKAASKTLTIVEASGV